MFDVAEKNIHAMLRVEWRLISQTVLVYLHFSWYTFPFHCGTDEHIVHDGGAAI
jgi:hypothetical protein